MALLKLRRFAQVTLPADIRRQFHLVEGDYLEAQVVKDGILLKPVVVVEKGEAWKQVFAAMKRVKDKKPTTKQTPQAQEEEIAEWVKDHRSEHA